MIIYIYIENLVNLYLVPCPQFPLFLCKQHYVQTLKIDIHVDDEFFGKCFARRNPSTHILDVSNIPLEMRVTR